MRCVSAFWPQAWQKFPVSWVLQFLQAEAGWVIIKDNNCREFRIPCRVYRSLKFLNIQSVTLAVNVGEFNGWIVSQLLSQFGNKHIEASTGDDTFVFPYFF